MRQRQTGEPPDFHESFARPSPPLGSNRHFGLLFALYCALVAGLVWWRGGGQLNAAVIGGAAGSGAFLALALFRPAVLEPLNRLWLRFGLLLARVVNPLVLALIFGLTIVPVGWWLRRAGRDPLRLRLAPEAASYWIAREPPGPEPASLRQPF